MKSYAIFIISWFGMAMIEQEIVLHKWIIYADSLGENNATWCMLTGK